VQRLQWESLSVLVLHPQLVQCVAFLGVLGVLGVENMSLTLDTLRVLLFIVLSVFVVAFMTLSIAQGVPTKKRAKTGRAPAG
jgi:hypothetical protein